MAQARCLANKVCTRSGAPPKPASHAPAPVMDRRSSHRDQVDTAGSQFMFNTSPLATCLGLICLPCTLLGMPTTIPPRHEAVATVFGKYIGAPLPPLRCAAARRATRGGYTSSLRTAPHS